LATIKSQPKRFVETHSEVREFSVKNYVEAQLAHKNSDARARNKFGGNSAVAKQWPICYT